MRPEDPRSIAEERLTLLHVLLESRGWQEVFVPALRREIGKRQHRLETTVFESVQEIAGLQEEIRLLKRMLEDPRRFVDVEKL